MRCPNCFHALTKKTFGKIEVEHCDYCGISIFESNEINRITLEDAKQLSSMRQTDVISGNEKFSPRDNSPFKRIENDSIPQFVTLLESQTTGEVFAYPDDLINFKKAQDAKVNYFRIWNIPLPALTNVLIYSFIIVTSFSIMYLSNRLQGPTKQSTQASNVCLHNIQIMEVDNQFIVSCETFTEFSSMAQFMCVDGDKTVSVNQNPGRVHIVTTEKNCQMVKFIFGEKGQTVETEWNELGR